MRDNIQRWGRVLVVLLGLLLVFPASAFAWGSTGYGVFVGSGFHHPGFGHHGFGHPGFGHPGFGHHGFVGHPHFLGHGHFSGGHHFGHPPAIVHTWVPGQWHWTGSTWVWVPAHWR